MSSNKAQYITLQDKAGSVFGGGIVDNVEPNLISYKNSPYGRNFRVTGQGISIRPGYSQFGSAFGGTGANAFGISAYERTTASNSRIIIGYKYSSTKYLLSLTEAGVQTEITTAGNITSENRMYFVNIGDSLYCMNGVDGLGKLDGTTYTVANVLVFNFGVYWNGSLWAATGNILYKSITDTPGTFTGGDSDQLTFPEPITGLSANNETLYVFTRNGIHVINNQTIRDVGGTLTYSSTALIVNEGAVNHASIASFGRFTFFLTKTNKLKRIAIGQGLGYDIVELSHRKYKGIDNTMSGLESSQDDSFAMEESHNNLIKWSLKSDGSSFNDIVIVYNVELDEFMIDNYKFFYGGTVFNGQSYTISQITTKAYLEEYGNSDDGVGIQFEYGTKLLDLGEPTVTKEIWEYRLYLGLNNATSLTVSTEMNGGQIDLLTIDQDDIPISTGGIGTTAIGTTAIGTEGFDGSDNLYNLVSVRDKGFLQARGKNFKFIFKCSSLGAKILLQKITPKIEQLNPIIY